MSTENGPKISWEDLLFAAMCRGDEISENWIPELTERQKERLLDALSELSSKEPVDTTDFFGDGESSQSGLLGFTFAPDAFKEGGIARAPNARRPRRSRRRDLPDQ